MRIALIHYRLLRNGGLETRLFNYLNEFQKLGYSITLVVSKVDPEIRLDAGIELRQVNLKLVPKPLRMYFFDSALKKIIGDGNFDLSFSLGRTSNQQIVLCPGNHLGYLKAIGKTFWSPGDLLNIYLDKIAFRKSRLILAASEMMKKELIDLYQVPSAKIHVLLPPIDSSRFSIAGKALKQKYRDAHGFSDTKKSLLFLTTGNKRKGYPFLLRLMQKMVDKPLELIVSGVKPLSTSLPNVKYVGYSNKPEELLWAADGLIHPALYEPFGQVITESIQCGTPVLISDKVGAKQIVSDEVGLVVNGFDENDWLKAIEDFLSRDFHFSENFSEQHGLTVQQHCKRIIDIVED